MRSPFPSVPSSVSTSSFFTQAVNFGNAVAGSVDPRTGLFNVQVSLGHLVGNNNLGPSFPLSLSYTPLSDADMGLGLGFSLGLTTLNRDNGLLTLSTGEQYKFIENPQNIDQDIVLQQKKLDTVHVHYDADSDVYRVVHKSGDVEVLTGRKNGWDLKVPTTLLTPSGHALNLAWDFTGMLNSTPLLTAISDGHDTLLSANYNDPSKVVLTVLPEKSEGYNVELRFGEPCQIFHFGLGPNEPLIWKLHTSPVGDNGVWGNWVTGVDMPGGMSETVTYGLSHAFPDSANLPDLPCVNYYTKTPGGGQPPIVATYTYSDNNFVGGYSDVDWDPGRDTLYGILSAYTYDSTESRTCNGKTFKVTRTYNNYHLLTEEKTQQGSYFRDVVTDYYAAIGQPFDGQPPQFQLPKKSTVTWSDGTNISPPEVTTTSFDENGNPQSRTDPGGTQTVWMFYPADGSVEGCPADPNGFTRFAQYVTHTPPSTAFDAPVTRTAYQYTSYAVPASYQSQANVPRADQVKSVVLKTGEEQYTDGGQTLLTAQSYTYTTSGNDAEFGRTAAFTEKEYPDGSTSDPYTTTHTFVFSVEGDTLSQTHTLATFDQLAVTRSEKRSRFTGRLRSATDAQGDTVAMTYDGLGRTLTQTANPNTAYAATHATTYAMNATVDGETVPFLVTSASPLFGTGNTLVDQVRVLYDGAGRPVKKDHKDVDGDGSWRTVQEGTYDEQGRPVSLTSTDWLPDGSQGGQSTITYLYDDWGQVYATQSSGLSGTSSVTLSTQVSQTDPVAQTTTSQLLDKKSNAVTGKIVTTHPVSYATPVTVQRFDLQGNPKGTRTLERDGLGRVRKETDEVGNTTLSDFDPQGRPSLTTLADGTQVARAYDVDISGDSLATGTYGTQVFDGMGRLTATTSGGRNWNYDYPQASDVIPTMISPPDGPQQIYTFITQLDNTLSKVQAGALTQDLTPDPVSGFLTKAQEGGVTITRDYWPSGLPKTETITGSGPDATATWQFTLGGNEYTYTSIDNTQQQTTRDDYGRLKSITDPDMQLTNLVYGTANRLTGWTTLAPNANYALSTSLTLDDLGREVGHTTEVSGGTGVHMWSQTQEWLDNDQLKNRKFYQDDSLVRTETFTYDNRNRLTNYTATGSQYPQDAQGRQVTAQTFTYDGYSNITYSKTTFADSSTDEATYTYDNPDPCQLHTITHTNPQATITLTYDAAGRLQADEAGRTLTYDPLGRLTATNQASTYTYDPQNRLLTQKAAPTSDTSTFYYRGETLAALTENDQTARLLHLGDTPVAQTRPTDSAPTRLLVTDTTHTIRAAATPTQQDTYAPTPYGQNPPHPTTILGYTGQRTDPITGCYPLGNGTRTYNPALQRFTTPDTLSPFGAGGINPYTYCAGDPINHTDPTGHLSWMAWVGIGLGVAGIALTVVTGGMAIAAAGGLMAAVSAASTTTLVVGALGTASDITAITSGALEKASPKASSILGWVSLGTGLPGLAEASITLARTGTKLAARAPQLTEDTTRVIEEIGDGASPGAGAGGGVAPPHVGRLLNEVNPYFSVENSKGVKIWVSEHVITGVQTRELMEDILSRGMKFHLFSGTHGGAFGERFPDSAVRSFMRDDVYKQLRLATKKGAEPQFRQLAVHSQVHDISVSPSRVHDILGQINPSEAEVILGFCFSRNDIAIGEILGLSPTVSYIPIRIKGSWASLAVRIAKV